MTATRPSFALVDPLPFDVAEKPMINPTIQAIPVQLNPGLLRRLRAAGVHLLISAVIAALAALLVFILWYPGAYRELAGGRELFLLLTAVDVVLGPLLTFAVFNPGKGWTRLRRDLVIIGLIQMAALGYGLHTVFVVRPIAMVLEGHRFRLISTQDIRMSELPDARPEYRNLPLTGPWLLGTRAPTSKQESSDALFLALKGADLGQRPNFWQPYSESTGQAIARSRPSSLLLAHYPSRAAELTAALRDMGVDATNSRFLPVVSRNEWSAVIDATGHPVGYLPVSGFF